MLCGVPHLKSFCLIGLLLAVLGTVGLSWAYPAFLNKVDDYRQSKTVQVWQETYGISAGASAGLVQSGSALSVELAASAPQPPTGTMLNSKVGPSPTN